MVKHMFPEYASVIHSKKPGKHVPHVKAKHIKGLSVPCVVVDYKTGNSVELLSQGEKYVWYLLRFDDDVVNIYEQHPLDLKITCELAKTHKIKHPRNKKVITTMTTDFYVEKKNGFAAYSVKNDRSVLDKPRNIEKLFLEKLYWEQLGIEFHIVFKEDLNMTLVNNIMDVVTCYHKDRVFDQYDKIRYKIAHKIIQLDLKDQLIDYEKLKEKENE